MLWGVGAGPAVSVGRRLAQLNPQAVQAFDPMSQGVGVLPHLEVCQELWSATAYFRSLAGR